MKRTLLFLSCLLLTVVNAWALSSLVIGKPAATSSYSTPAQIKDVDILVKPQGLYAQVEITFSIKGAGSATDTLESVLNFDLPANSFIHDSWLWLNDSTIIVAAIIERNKASQTYGSIVKRRQDPSLLLKTSANTYQLNIYPFNAGSSFTRKVKIIYSVPFSWNGTSASVPLPIEIPLASSVQNAITVRVATDNVYSQPSFAETNFSSLVTNVSGNTTVLAVPANLYQGVNGLTLKYSTAPASGNIVFDFPTSSTSGYYQALIQPSSFGAGSAASRNINFILDPGQQNNYYSIYTYPEIGRYLRSYMLTTLNPTDSFNVFFVTGGAVVQLFPGWASANTTNVNNAINAMAVTPTNDPSKYSDLYKQALAFTQTRPATTAQTIILSSSYDYTYQQQTAVDNFFNGVKVAIGNIVNKISVVNYGSSYYANQLLFNKFCTATGGVQFTYSKVYYNNISHKNSYDLDVIACLRSITQQMSPSTNAYNINLPMASGFLYSRQDISGVNRYSTREPYTEVGKYVGSFQSGGNVQVQYLSSTGMVSNQQPLSAINGGTKSIVRSWVIYL